MYSIITYLKDGKTLYWRIGQTGAMTEVLEDARRYGRNASARQALLRLKRRTDLDVTQLKVVDIKELND